MPISPELAVKLSAGMLRLAGQTELALIKRVRDGLAPGMESPRWADEKLAALQQLQAALQRDGARFVQLGTAEARSAAEAAATAGRTVAAAELRAALRGLKPVLPGLDAAIALALEMTAPIGVAAPGILRATVDGYRAAVAEASFGVITGADTRRQAAQRALDRWAARGITGFMDSRGRQWDMSSYAEMATRSAVQKAMTQAHVQTLADNGTHYVIVSNAPQECEKCRPYEGKILALPGGQVGSVTVDGHTFDVLTTLQQAESKGLFHPGCRHSTGAYLPGFTQPHAGPTADPQGDKDRQKLRYLERKVRAAKRLEAAALDDAAATKARARVRAAQAEIRSHVATTTAKRQPARERIGAAR